VESGPEASSNSFDNRSCDALGHGTGSTIFSWQISDQNLGVCRAPDGERVVTFTDDRDTVFLDATTGQKLADLKHCWSADWSPDSSRLLVGCQDGIYLDTASGKTLTTLKGKQGALGWEAAWDPTGAKVLATQSSDTFYVFEKAGGALFRTFSIPEPWIVRGIWDREGKRVTVFSGDRIVSAFGFARVFDVNTAKQLAVFRGHEKNILGGRWDPSGTKLLTWSQDTTSRIWDVGTNRELAKLSGHGDFVSSGEWSKDGAHARYYAPPPYTWDVKPFLLDPMDRVDWMRASLGISTANLDLQEPTEEQFGSIDARAVCERGAENPIDPMRRFLGVQLREIDPYPHETAPACEKAISELPFDGRLNYLYGRTMLHMGEKKKAYAAFETAVAHEYAIASIDLGEMLLDPTDTEHYDPERGVEMIAKIADELPMANVALARHFEKTNHEKAAEYLGRATRAGESHAYQLLAEEAEERAQKSPGAIEQWVEAFRNWSIAFNFRPPDIA
jgi:hypothetical protein